jgi:hypothetical protein
MNAYPLIPRFSASAGDAERICVAPSVAGTGYRLAVNGAHHDLSPLWRAGYEQHTKTTADHHDPGRTKPSHHVEEARGALSIA